MVDAGERCIGWEARDRDLMRGTVLAIMTLKYGEIIKKAT